MAAAAGIPGIEQLHALAEQEGIFFLPGDVCYAGDIPSRHIRLSYSQLTQEGMERGLRRFLLLLERHLRS